MLTHSIPYALLCVAAPVAWGLIVYWISSWIEKRVSPSLGKDPENKVEPGEDKLPLEYHI